MSKAPRSACSRPASPRPSHGRDPPRPPPETALGALLGHITGGAEAETYQPMNVNFGLMPPIEGRTKKADRKTDVHRPREGGAGEWLAIRARQCDEGGNAVEASGAAFSSSPTL